MNIDDSWGTAPSSCTHKMEVSRTCGASVTDRTVTGMHPRWHLVVATALSEEPYAAPGLYSISVVKMGATLMAVVGLVIVVLGAA